MVVCKGDALGLDTNISKDAPKNQSEKSQFFL